jgi:hypothetical protein
MTHQEQITNLALTIAWLTRSLHERDNTIGSLRAATQSDQRELTLLRTVEKTALLVASKHGCRREMAKAMDKVAPEAVYDCKVTFR